MCYSLENKESGFTLVELLIAMTIGLIILAALSSTFLMQRKIYDVQEQIVEMVQTARAAMDMMTREIRIAGYNPANVSFDGIPHNANSSTIDVYADLNGNGSIDTTSGTYEHITYSYDSANKLIRRNTNTGGGNQPFAENIDSFSVSYLNANGGPATTTSEIRQARITITARRAKPDPDSVPYTLTSLITPRNLGL
jgi:type IV pilus assembly protein PilW